MTMPLLRAAAAIVLFAALSPRSDAQWSSNAGVNLPVGNRTGEQSVPKLSARADGGAYIAWFDSNSGGYTVQLQRVDANGYEAWPHFGITVSANPQSTSLVDWDLITDSAGNAVLVFTDTRSGGDLDVYAYRISPTGTFLWGPNGIPLSNDAHYEANPVVAEMTDGTFVVAWNRSPTGTTGRLAVQRLDSAGGLLYGPSGFEITGGATDDPGFVGIVAADAGSFILSWIRDTTPFLAPRHLWTQKYDALGAPLWGSAPLVVYDAAGLPIAYKPELIPDGSGGAWHAWHVSVGSYFQGRVQHVSSAGAEVFAHNGVEISLEAARSELYPAMVPLAGTGDLLVFYNKRDAAQATWGISGQRISATGQLVWGNNGIDFVPYDAVTEEVPRAIPTSNGAMVFVEQGNFTTTLLGFRVDANGIPLWTPSPISVSSIVSPKDKLRAVTASDGTAIVVWSDGRSDINDIYAQNVELDGSLGIPPAAATPYGCGPNPSGSLVVVSGSAALSATLTIGIDAPPGVIAAPAATALAVALAPLPGYPCGVLVPGFGLASPGTPGELLVDLGSLVFPILVGGTWNQAGSPVNYPFAIPALPSLVGATVYLQGALVEPGTARTGLTNALAVRFGP